MEDIFRLTDDLGPAKVIHIYEPKLGLRAILVSTTSPAGLRSAAAAWRPMSASRNAPVSRAP